MEVVDGHALAWAAGFLDGEGHFGAYRRDAYIEASQTGTDEPQRVLQRLFGGTIRKHGISDSGRERFMWKVSSPPEVRMACVMLLPYLVAKREQAALLLTYAMTFTGVRGMRPDAAALALRNDTAVRLRSARWGG